MEGVDGSRRIFNIVFVLVVVYTLVQGPTLPWLARKLRLGKGTRAADLGIESAPLEWLRGHLPSVTIPEGSRMHGVEVSELRLPTGAAVTLVVRDGKSFVPLPTTGCGAGTNSSWSPPTPSGTPPRRGCARSATAASWPAGWAPETPAAVTGARRGERGCGAGAGVRQSQA